MAPNPLLGVRLLGLVSRSSKPLSELIDDELIAARDRLNRLRVKEARMDSKSATAEANWA
jgi:hypothetical protein